MSDKTVSVGLKIEGDAKGARAAIDSTGKSLDELSGHTAKARSSSEQLNGSFNKLGIRSAAQIEADILAINQALQQLALRGNVSGAEFDRAMTAAQARLGALHAEMGGLPVASTQSGIAGLSGAFATLQGTLAALGIGAVGEKFLQANLAADKLQKSLNAVNGDAGKTAGDLAFLKETAQRLGINLESSSAAFVRLAAAAKGSALEGQATRDIFSGLGGALAQLGLSSAETERAFIAVAQMMSKGTVNAEELKGQLGDVVPGAMQIAARATGLTTQELGKLMEAGGLLAEDFLPKFAAEAQRSFGGVSGDVQGMSNNMERVKNTWAQAFKIFGETGVLAALGGAVGVVNEGLLLLATGVTAVVSGFFALVKASATLTSALFSLDFSQLKDSLLDIASGLVDNVTQMARLTGTAKLVGTALEETATGTGRAASTAKTAAAGWEKLVVVYDQAVKSMADYAAQVKRVTKADDEQAEVLVKLAELAGQENDLLRAKEAAARRAAQGADAVAKALDNEAKALQAKVMALQEEIKGQKNVSEEKIKAIEEAKKVVEAKTEEARAARASADASAVAAGAAQTEANARADNSGRVQELKAAYEQASVAVDVLKAAQLAGVEVGEALTAAQIKQAAAAALVKDALADQTAKIQQNLAAREAQIGIEQAGVRLAIEQQRTIYEVARARGDEYGATQALLEIKRLEIKLAGLTAQAKQAEAEAALLTAQARREELRAMGPLTAAQEAELKVLDASAKVKQVEAQIAGETAKRMRELADAYGQAGASAAGAAGHIGGIGDAARGSVPGVDALTDSLNRMNAAQRGGGGGGSGESSNGIPGSSSNGINGVAGTAKSILDDPDVRKRQAPVDIATEMYKRGASIEEVKAAQKYYGELYDRNAATMLTGNLGNGQNAARQQNIAMTDAMDKAIKFARQELATGQAVDLGTSVRDFEARNLATTKARSEVDQMDAIKRAGNEASNQTRTIRLELGSGGRKSSVYADSEADAAAFIKTIEAAGMRTRR